jgi:hypothetical protein
MESEMTSRHIGLSGLRAAAEKEGEEMEFSKGFKAQGFTHGHAQISDFEHSSSTAEMAHNIVELPDFKSQTHTEIPLTDMLRNSKGIAKALPEIKNVASLDNVINQGKAKAKSGPLAARGVTIKRTLTNRREGSSRSQKKVNPDATLAAWSQWPEYEEE